MKMIMIDDNMMMIVMMMIMMVMCCPSKTTDIFDFLKDKTHLVLWLIINCSSSIKKWASASLLFPCFTQTPPFLIY